MLRIRFIPLVVKQVVRHRTRSVLTVAGVAVAMFLFCTVQAMQAGAASVTQTAAADTTLVVYRQHRYCPFTSRLPQSYEDRIRRIPGVVGVVPMRIAVNNCRTSLDVVTFRGVPSEAFMAEYLPRLEVLSGSVGDWQRRSDAALLGETLARRRGLRPGDRFSAAGVTVYVAGIIRSDEPQHANVGYTHLSFLQFATGDRQGGAVTQFNVRVARPEMLESVAAAIDAEFAADQDPTQTYTEKAFVARAASDVLGVIAFTRWLGWGCLAAVLAVVGNAIALAVQGRVRELAVLQTLGFGQGLVARLTVAESIIIACVGGAVGSLATAAVLWWGQFSLSVEGLYIPIRASAVVIVGSLGISVLLGVMAGAWPAWKAARRPIVESLRAV